MRENGLSKLHSLLFTSEEELVNVKFFPGSGRGLTCDQFAEAGAEMIAAARKLWSEGVPSNPPRTNARPVQLLG